MGFYGYGLSPCYRCFVGVYNKVQCSHGSPRRHIDSRRKRLAELNFFLCFVIFLGKISLELQSFPATTSSWIFSFLSTIQKTTKTRARLRTGSCNLVDEKCCPQSRSPITCLKLENKRVIRIYTD